MECREPHTISNGYPRTSTDPHSCRPLVQVIDQRMSMVSQGTWQPPRGSTSTSRPGSSFHPDMAARNSTSVYSGMEGHGRPHPFADPTRPNSAYSVGTSSPLASGFVRPLPPAEMRQVGHGERGSKVSFIPGEGTSRPSFTSSRKGGPPTSIYARSSMHQGAPASTSHLRHSRVGSDAQQLDRSYSSVSSGASGSGSGGNSPVISRSGTREELSAMAMPMPRSNSNGAIARQPGGNAHQASVASSLRQDLASYPAIAVLRDGQLAYNHGSPPHSPFLDPSPPAASPVSPTMPKPPRPTLQVHTDTSDASHMPMAARNSLLSPDQALASYAVFREASSPSPTGAAAGGATSPPLEALTQPRMGLTRAASSFLGALAPGRMLRNLTSTSINSNNNPAAQQGGRPGATSPFDDPPSPTGSEKEDPYAAFDEGAGRDYSTWTEGEGEKARPHEVEERQVRPRPNRTSSLPSRYSGKSDYRGQGDEAQKEEVPFGVAL